MTIRDAKGARAAKAKGRSFEQSVADYLSGKLELTIERRRTTGIADCGDLSGWTGRVVECKNEKKITLSKYMHELEAEMEAATRRFGVSHKGVVVIKKRGTTDIGASYAVVPLRVMVELLR